MSFEDMMLEPEGTAEGTAADAADARPSDGTVGEGSHSGEAPTSSEGGESTADSQEQASLCENCRAELAGPFCHQCGQADLSLDLSFRAFAGEWLGSVFGFDGRVWRTLGLLLKKPGALSEEYLQGRRARYVSPLRLYFFVSLATFLVLAVTGADLVKTGSENYDKNKKTITTEGGQRISYSWWGSADDEDLDDEDLDDQDQGSTSRAEDAPATVEAADPPTPEAPTPSGQEPNTADEPVDLSAESSEPASSETGETSIAEGQDPDGEETLGSNLEEAVEESAMDPDRLSSEFLNYLPQAIFFLVPVYAWLLKLFFRRRYRSYLQHLVVSLHLHATAFVLMTVGHLADLAMGFGHGSDPGQALAARILVIHPFMARRRVYGERRRVLLVKYMVLSFLHLMALLLALLATLFFAFYRMGVFD